MRIVFATDGSAGATVAEDFLLALPLSCADQVVLVTACSGDERDAFDVIAHSRWRFGARDIATTTTIRAGHAADVAQAVALEHGADLLVVGSRGRGELTGAVLGSVARSLAHDGVTPLLVVRSRHDAPRRVLLIIDGSSDARAAIDVLAQLPLPAAVSIEVLRAAVPGQSTPDEAIVERARILLGKRIARHDAIDGEHLGEAVTRRALHANADLVVLGTRGQTQGSGILGSSVADHVVTHAHCAVLVAKAPLATRRVKVAAAALAAGVS